MYTAKPTFVAREVTVYNLGLPEIYKPVQQTSWSESYAMYGERKTFYSDDLSNYKNYSKFKAGCNYCGHFTGEFFDSEMAVIEHFLHCAVEHGYVYSTDAKPPLDIVNVKLQEIITLSHKYNLPMPGYDEHKKCVKQYDEDMPLCIAHEGNYTVKTHKIWLGWY